MLIGSELRVLRLVEDGITNGFADIKIGEKYYARAVINNELSPIIYETSDLLNYTPLSAEESQEFQWWTREVGEQYWPTPTGTMIWLLYG